MTQYFNNVYIKDYYSLLGRNKHKITINADKVLNDYYNGEKSVELGEISYMILSINGLLNKDNISEKDIDLCINSDLQNQMLSSNYSMRKFDIPTIAHYSACASFAGNLILASNFVNNGLKNILVNVSSHNLSSEKQFRYPIEYGSIRKYVNTFTASGCVSTLVSNEKSKIKVESATVGKVIDIGYDDANNFGACMAPSAAETIYNHLLDTKRDIKYYDLVLTGDLGVYGLKIKGILI